MKAIEVLLNVFKIEIIYLKLLYCTARTELNIIELLYRTIKCAVLQKYCTELYLLYSNVHDRCLFADSGALIPVPSTCTVEIEAHCLYLLSELTIFESVGLLIPII